MSKPVKRVNDDIMGLVGLSAPKFKPPVVEPIESVSTVTEAATDTKKKVRKPTGRSNALLAGVANALKKRLGE